MQYNPYLLRVNLLIWWLLFIYDHLSLNPKVCERCMLIRKLFRVAINDVASFHVSHIFYLDTHLNIKGGM